MIAFTKKSRSPNCRILVRTTGTFVVWQLMVAVALAQHSEAAVLDDATVPCSASPDGFWQISVRSCSQFIWRRDDCCATFTYCTTCGACPSSRAAFLQSLTPGVPVCFAIHGSYLKRRDTGEDAVNTFRWIRRASPHQPIHFVYVTWPSEATIPPIDMMLLGRHSARNGLHLATLITQIAPSHPISLVGHSHGARMVLATLNLMGGGAVLGHRLPHRVLGCRRFRAVLGAAAVDHHWLNPGERYDHVLCHTEGILNLRNSQDLALRFYPLRKPFSKRALGRSGLTRRDYRKLGVLSSRICEVEVSPLIGRSHFWSNYYRNDSLAQMAVQYLYFSDGEATQQASARSKPVRIEQSPAQRPTSFPSPVGFSTGIADHSSRTQ